MNVALFKFLFALSHFVVCDFIAKCENLIIEISDMKKTEIVVNLNEYV